MKTSLTNINEFIKKLSSRDDIEGLDLFEQYYFSEKKENIKIYSELIKKMNDKFFIVKMTKEEEQKYWECLHFLNSEIKKAQKNYQRKYVDKLVKINKLLTKNQQDIDSSLRISNNYSEDIKNLAIKKISKWKNTFFKIISLNFFDWNKKIITQQQRLKDSKDDNDNLIKKLEAKKEKIKEEKINIDLQFKKDLLKINNVIADFDLLEQRFNDLVFVKSNNEDMVVKTTSRNINDEIKCEIAEEVFEMFVPLNKSKNSFSSQDSGFDSKSNSDSEQCSYREELNPFSNNYDYSNSQSSINIKKSDSLKI